MSVADRDSIENERQTRITILKQHRGFRLTLVFAVVAACWGWSLNWASGRSIPGSQVMGPQLWQFAPFILGCSISLVCLGWALKVLWDGLFRTWTAPRAPRVPAHLTMNKKAWVFGKEAQTIASVLVTGLLVSLIVGLISGAIIPVVARAVFLAAGTGLWVVLIRSFFHMLDNKAREGNWRKFSPLLIAPPIISMAAIAILNDPSKPGARSPLYWALWAAIAVASAVIPASTLPGLMTVALVRRGQYDLALNLSQIFFWALGNTRSTQGWILVMAGRYTEAKNYLKPLAFDTEGHPRLTSQEFFLYTLALSIEGENATAEMLYEAAVNVPQKTGDFHFGLADCLLTQKKDVDRARRLVESVLAGYPANPRSTQQRANRAQMLAFHAWTLASNGWRSDAEQRLKEATESAAGCDKCSLAALNLPIGDTWLTLGETDKARTAYADALKLFPFGDVGVRARRKLASLDVEFQKSA
jgi:tetratricopeptide (TPR) repeat protein